MYYKQLATTKTFLLTKLTGSVTAARARLDREILISARHFQTNLV